MTREQVHKAVSVVAAGLFVLVAWELAVLGVLGPDAFVRNAYLLTGYGAVVVPAVVLTHALLFWLRLPAAANSVARFQAALLALSATGAVLYAAVVAPVLPSGQNTFTILFDHLGEPWWGIAALLVLTSAAFAFFLGASDLLRRVAFENRPQVALAVSGLVVLLLWLSALNGLAVLVVGAPLFGEAAY